MALSPEDYRRAKEIVLEAIERPQDAREAFVERACGSDPDLRNEVRRLLELHDEAPDSFLGEPLLAGAAELVRGAAAEAGEAATGVGVPAGSMPERVGPYRPLRVLGQGGMGVVYEAEQSEPIRRRVALKVIRTGMDSKEVLARFDAERQALAVMDHPAIARVLDVGETENGRPYFAMELVRGAPIHQFSDAARLTTRERVELLRAVCQAVQHAHQKGVVHRDLKPSNVLVTEQDGRPVPKIIDFGVAKALEPASMDQSLLTQTGQAIGTPAYMSPEQAEGSTLDIDTRTDVYALGVMLHELLTGRLPHESEGSARRYLSKLAAGETEPPTPSSQVSTLADERAKAIARARRASLESLRRQLRGDLDRIVLKAMDPDRARRYETVSALEADLRRHLANEPVEARRPTSGYRLRKFVRRHRAGVAAATTGLVLLLVFSAVVSHQAVQLARQRDEARRQAETATQVAGFLEGLFEAADPTVALGEELTARQLLDKVVERLRAERDLEGQPLVRARLLLTLGRVHRNLGLFEEAEGLLREALEAWPLDTELRRAERAETEGALGLVLKDRAEYDRARAHLEEALAVTREVGDPLGNEGGLLNNLGHLLRLTGDFAGARETLERSRDLTIARLGADHPDVAAAHANLAALAHGIGDYEAAREGFERALTIQEQAAEPELPIIAVLAGNLAQVQRRLGDLDAAQQAGERSLTLRERIYGPDHPEVAAAVLSLAAVHRRRGEVEEARRLFERGIQIQTDAKGAEHPHVAAALMGLGTMLARSGEPAEARRILVRALEIRENALGPEHPAVADTVSWLGMLQDAGGEYQAARDSFARALAIGEASLGPDHPQVSVWRRNLAQALEDTGAGEEAVPLRERAVLAAERTAGAEHPDVALRLDQLATTLRRLGENGRAEEALERALTIRKAVLEPDDPEIGVTLFNLAAVVRDQGRSEAARELYEGSLRLLRRVLPPDDVDLIYPLNGLAVTLRQQGDADQAERLLREALSIGEASLPPGHAVRANVRQELIGLLRDAGRADEAEELQAGAAAESGG